MALRWIDLPVEEVREVLADPSGDRAMQVLANHRRRLRRQEGWVGARIADVDYFLEKGIHVSSITGTRPVQLKLSVNDVDESITFYQQAFGFRFDVTRRTEDSEYSSFIFSRYGEDDFFLIHLLGDPEQADRLGPTTFGLQVAELDATHASALQAGATEVSAPHDAEGMPRCSAVKDPSGNWIWLYQG